MDQGADHLDVVTGHDHLLVGILNTLGPGQGNSDISSAEEALGAVVAHERSVATTFVLGQDLQGVSWGLQGSGGTYVELGNKLLGSLDRSRESDDLTTADLLALDTTEESTHVVTGLSTVELLAEHLNASEGSLDVRTEANNFDFGTFVGNTTLNLLYVMRKEGRSLRNRHLHDQ